VSGRRQKSQIDLAFPAGQKGEAPTPAREGTEPPTAARASERPANTDQVMEEIVERANLTAALRRVKANKGSPGVDGMTVQQLPGYLTEHWPALRAQLLQGTYQPQPVKRVEIPKPGGGTRKLGVPTVLDRFLQQAVLQVLQRRWDRTFSPHSYGFRPHRSAHQAVAQAQQYVAAGNGWVVDLDLEKILRPSQPGPTDGASGEADHRHARVAPPPSVPDSRSAGGRAGESDRRGDSARRSTLAPAQQPRPRCVGSGAATASSGMRTTVTFTSAANERGSG